MPKVTIQKTGKIIEVAPGANLMSTLLDASLPVASSCGGDGVCRKCRVQVLQGKEHLSEPTPTEEFLWECGEYEKNERMSCQAQIVGDITVSTTYW